MLFLPKSLREPIHVCGNSECIDTFADTNASKIPATLEHDDPMPWTALAINNIV